MQGGARDRLLASGLVLLVAASAALAGCNSSSGSGSQRSQGASTSAETKSPTNPAGGSGPKGLIEAVNSKVR
jgi:hypothetical protein